MDLVIGCSVVCKEPPVGRSDYYPYGVVERPYTENMEVRLQNDTWRFRLTWDPYEVDVFKFALLRNVVLTQPYFHSGRVWKPEDSVSLMSNGQLGIEVDSLETELITAFLHILPESSLS